MVFACKILAFEANKSPETAAWPMYIVHRLEFKLLNLPWGHLTSSEDPQKIPSAIEAMSYYEVLQMVCCFRVHEVWGHTLTSCLSRG